jgi:hypothetical protein
MANTGKMKFDGKITAIKALKKKLNDVNQRWHEASRFKEGDLEAIEQEAEFLKAQIAEFENELHEMHEEIKEVVDEMSEFREMQDMQQETLRDAKIISDAQDMEKVADRYRGYGIDCEVEVGRDGKFEINVKNPGKFEGQNLLEMSAEKLMDLVEDVEKQEVEAEKEQEKSSKTKEKEQGQEKSRSKSSEAEEEVGEEKKRKPKVGDLLPGDAVEERGSQDAGSLTKSKEEEKPSVLSSAKNVKPGEKFDSGISHSMKGNAKAKGKENSAV